MRTILPAMEVMPAREYYGAHATGVVVLVGGSPTHFTGESAQSDAQTYAKNVISNHQRVPADQQVGVGQVGVE